VISEEKPEYLSDGLFVFHNPHAKNKMDPKLFKKSNAVQVFAERGGLRFEGENSPIFSRLNLPKFMIIADLITKIAEDFNG
jgi:hypothetical protein